MTEKKIHKIEQEDIIIPDIMSGETALVFQRHGKYNRDCNSPDAGSLFSDDADRIQDEDTAWFSKVLSQSGAPDDTYVLFTSSDTQYAAKGYRSLETGQLAQNAAAQVMKELGIDPNRHIINCNKDFAISRSYETDQAIRPMPGVREPEIFNPADKDYIQHLQAIYGYSDEVAKKGLSPAGWAAHEMDSEMLVRQTAGAEGQQDLIDRTKKSLYILQRYARVWHVNNPGKRLVIWLTSHYDTVNPLVKEVEGQLKNDDGSFSDTYQPVDYGGGIVLKFPKADTGDVLLETRVHHGRKIALGNTATRQSVTRLGLPKY